MHLTVKAKLISDPKQQDALSATMTAFNEACDYISTYAFQNEIFSKYELQKKLYEDVRERFGLNSQATIRACAKVADSYNSGKWKHRRRIRHFKPRGAVIYDARLLSLKKLDLVSLSTLEGRLHIPMIFGKRNDELLARYPRRGEVDLVYVQRTFYLHFVVEVPEPNKLAPAGFIGVDFGIVNLATTSEGTIYTGKHVDRKRRNTTRRKKGLQKRNGKKAKYSLKKLSGKERRFKRNTNHVIAKQLVERAKALRVGIAIEDLSGFRATVSRKQRERFGKWAFYELRTLIEYKAALAGVPVVAVNPRNTSRMCSRCRHTSKKNRPTQSQFACQKCGFSMNADKNAAINIASRAIEDFQTQQTAPLVVVVEGCSVSQPHVVQLLLPFAEVLGTTSPPALAVGS